MIKWVIFDSPPQLIGKFQKIQTMTRIPNNELQKGLILFAADLN